MKLPTIFYEQAIKSLRPNANWGNKNGELIYFGNDCPTDKEIKEKAQELQTEYDAKKYQRDRAAAFPSWQEQMDMQYWDAKNGTTTWQDAVAAVKTKFPKGE